MVIFHSYVSLPEGTYRYRYIYIIMIIIITIQIIIINDISLDY